MNKTATSRVRVRVLGLAVATFVTGYAAALYLTSSESVSALSTPARKGELSRETAAQLLELDRSFTSLGLPRAVAEMYCESQQLTWTTNEGHALEVGVQFLVEGCGRQSVYEYTPDGQWTKVKPAIVL